VHRQYTVIGDTVNIGSRHCSLAREGQIVVSDAAGALLGHVPGATRVDGVAIKGTDGTHSLWLIQAGPTVTSGSPELSLPPTTEIDILETV
jgi:class 3 adenylate cyclase